MRSHSEAFAYEGILRKLSQRGIETFRIESLCEGKGTDVFRFLSSLDASALDGSGISAAVEAGRVNLATADAEHLELSKASPRMEPTHLRDRYAADAAFKGCRNCRDWVSGLNFLNPSTCVRSLSSPADTTLSTQYVVRVGVLSDPRATRGAACRVRGASSRRTWADVPTDTRHCVYMAAAFSCSRAVQMSDELG